MTTETQLSALRDTVDGLPAWLCDHIHRVEEEAVRLAQRYGEDTERARLAAFGHDLVRHKNDSELLALAAQYGIVPDAVEQRSPILVHGPIAARMLRLDFGMEDGEIIAGVDCHTTARPGMALVEKILFIADKIEPHKLRANGELNEVYALAESGDIDAAVVRFLDFRIDEAVRKGTPIHPRLLEARNELLLNRP